jgi:hypothetical protein
MNLLRKKTLSRVGHFGAHTYDRGSINQDRRCGADCTCRRQTCRLSIALDGRADVLAMTWAAEPGDAYTTKYVLVLFFAVC